MSNQIRENGHFHDLSVVIFAKFLWQFCVVNYFRKKSNVREGTLQSNISLSSSSYFAVHWCFASVMLSSQVIN